MVSLRRLLSRRPQYGEETNLGPLKRFELGIALNSATIGEMANTVEHQKNLANTLWIDTDNGLGSKSGDIDDGFALLLACQLNLTRVSTSYGNTSAESSLLNTNLLKELTKTSFEVFEGASRTQQPSSKILNGLTTELSKVTYLAMGPLTELEALLNPEQRTFKKVLALGGRPDHKGFLYPYWPHEFNFAKDPEASQAVFRSQEDIFLVGLDHAQKLQYNLKDWLRLRDSPFPLKTISRRWILRNLFLKLQPKLILWDVVAVATLIWPELFTWQLSQVSCDAKGRLRFCSQGKTIHYLKTVQMEELKKRTLSCFCKA